MITCTIHDDDTVPELSKRIWRALVEADQVSAATEVVFALHQAHDAQDATLIALAMVDELRFVCAVEQERTV